MSRLAGIALDVNRAVISAEAVQRVDLRPGVAGVAVDEHRSLRKQEADRARGEIEPLERTAAVELLDGRLDHVAVDARRDRAWMGARAGERRRHRCVGEVLREHVVEVRIGHCRGEGAVELRSICGRPHTDIDVRERERRNGLPAEVAEVEAGLGLEAGSEDGTPVGRFRGRVGPKHDVERPFHQKRPGLRGQLRLLSRCCRRPLPQADEAVRAYCAAWRGAT